MHLVEFQDLQNPTIPPLLFVVVVVGTGLRVAPPCSEGTCDAVGDDELTRIILGTNCDCAVGVSVVRAVGVFVGAKSCNSFKTDSKGLVSTGKVVCWYGVGAREIAGAEATTATFVVVDGTGLTGVASCSEDRGDAAGEVEPTGRFGGPDFDFFDFFGFLGNDTDVGAIFWNASQAAASALLSTENVG